MRRSGEVVGSGPYRFLKDEFVSGSRVTYAKFDGYVPRQEAADWASGGKVAHFPRIEWHILPDPATAAAALQSGEVDWLEQPLSDLIPTLGRNRNIVLEVLNPCRPDEPHAAQSPAGTLQRPRDPASGGTRGEPGRLHARDARARPVGLAGMPQPLPCGTPLGVEDLSELTRPPRSLDRAKAALAASGYRGERVVIINPTDFPLIGPHGQVTADLLRRMGMNVDLAESDWGTVVQRRVRRSR